MIVALSAPEAEVPTILGAKGGNVALGNLLVALEENGLVVDETT